MLPAEVEFFMSNDRLDDKYQRVVGFGSSPFFPGFSALEWTNLQADVSVPCDVIEGACTVDCGGARKIVCDTGDFSAFFADQPSGSPVALFLWGYNNFLNYIANDDDRAGVECFTSNPELEPCSEADWPKEWQENFGAKVPDWHGCAGNGNPNDLSCQTVRSSEERKTRGRDDRSDDAA